MTVNDYLEWIIARYQAQDLSGHASKLNELKKKLESWASGCFINIHQSGSRAKNTAISIASDVDYLVSLSAQCNEGNGGLKACYDGLYQFLKNEYTNVRKQNVSIRIELDGLEIDITPARKYSGNTNYHNLYYSKNSSWKLTNIQQHINDVSKSGRTPEIKLLKVWRELHNVDFPSIYLEYLVINVLLLNKSKDAQRLADNFFYILEKLAQPARNPLYFRIIDPSNSNNILSDLLSDYEKGKIIQAAKKCLEHADVRNTLW